jgi:hypothetical protein
MRGSDGGVAGHLVILLVNGAEVLPSDRLRGTDALRMTERNDLLPT